MTEKRESTGSGSKAQEFVKKYWPLLALGGLTAVGVGVWMTVRYIKENRERRAIVDTAMLDRLDRLELEALAGIADGAKLLETTSGLTKLVGADEVIMASGELATNTTDPKVREVLEAVGGISKLEK